MKVKSVGRIDFTYAIDSVIFIRDYNIRVLVSSSDYGVTWSSIIGPPWSTFESYFAKIGNTFYAADGASFYSSTDFGRHWENKESKGDDWVNAIISVDSILIAGYAYAGISRSLDSGSSFHYASEGMDAAYVQRLNVYNGQLMTSGYLQGVFNYDPALGQWQRSYYDEDARLLCHDLEEYEGSLYLAGSGEIYKFDSVTHLWNRDGPEKNHFIFFTDFYQSPYGLLAWGNQDGFGGRLHIYDQFNNWTPFIVNVEGEDFNALNFAQNDQYQFLAFYDQLARAQNGESDWKFLPINIESIQKMIVFGNGLYVIHSEDEAHLRLSYSNDNGQTWKYADDGIADTGYGSGINNLIEAGDYLICTTNGYASGIYYARKDDLQWHPFNEGLPYLGVKDVILEGEYLYAATGGQGVWKRKLEDLFLSSYEKPEPISSIQIYPNPANELFHFRLQGGDDVNGKMSMYDMQGRLMMQDAEDDLNKAVQVTNIPDGMYWIKWQTASGNYSGKVIIQH